MRLERIGWGALAVAVFVLFIPTVNRRNAQALPWQSFASSIGHPGRLQLADGRTLYLDSGTQLSVQSTDARTLVVLHRGEALIEGVGSKRLDLICNGTLISAGNAGFSVRRRDAMRTDVLVASGAVDAGVLSPMPAAARRLSADEFGTFAQRVLLATHSLGADVVAHKLAWKDGWLWFSDDSLADAVERFNGYNDKRRLVVSDARLLDLTIGGRFRPTDTDSFVRTLQRIFNVSVRIVRSPAGDLQTWYLRSAAADP